MVVASQRAILFIWVALLLVAVLGLLALWSIQPFWPPIQEDTPTDLTVVSLPCLPNSLAWSPDSVYIAAGTWGTSGEASSGEVLVVEVALASVKTRLQVTCWVDGLAFS